MPKIKYELCPRCDEKKVSELTQDERRKVNGLLHNAHVIHAPYEVFRVWACHSCGWVVPARWNKDTYTDGVYRKVRLALAPDPLPVMTSTVTLTPVVDYDDEVE